MRAGSASNSRRSLLVALRGWPRPAGRGAAAPRRRRAPLPSPVGRRRLRPLPQPVLVAAHVLRARGRRPRRRSCCVTTLSRNAPVVAHEQQRARPVDQLRFEQLERLEVEVVGRLVEHQHVGRPREQARQQQPVALAARQRLDRRAGALGRKQEVLQVPVHVTRAGRRRSRVSLPSPTVSTTVRSGSSCSRCWSK